MCINILKLSLSVLEDAEAKITPTVILYILAHSKEERIPHDVYLRGLFLWPLLR